MGAVVVRVEETIDNGGLCKPQLSGICAFIGEGDELLVPELRQLGETAEAIREVVRRLDAKRAVLRVLEPEISTAEAAGRAFVEALAAVDRLCPIDPEPPARARPSPVQAWDVHALRAQGFGPSQIARRLGVSRMTVWRKLNEREAVG